MALTAPVACMVLVVALLAPATGAGLGPGSPHDTKSLEVEIFEQGLTALLIQYLTPVDPALLAEYQLLIKAPSIDLDLRTKDMQCRGFSELTVTDFEPPLPFISKEMRVALVMDRVHLNATAYNMTGSALGRIVSGAGRVWSTLDELRLGVSFKTYATSLRPPGFCVQRHTFQLSLSAGSMMWHFDGMDFLNQHMKVVAPLLLAEIQRAVNGNWEQIEHSLNEIFCNSFALKKTSHGNDSE